MLVFLAIFPPVSLYFWNKDGVKITMFEPHLKEAKLDSGPHVFTGVIDVSTTDLLMARLVWWFFLLDLWSSLHPKLKLIRARVAKMRD